MLCRALRPTDGEGAKLEIWTRLKLLAFTRAACLTWLVPLLDLLLRVQLNVLGRHLFLESHLLDRCFVDSSWLNLTILQLLHNWM